MPFSVRQIAFDADRLAVNSIFPEFRQQPFFLRSLGDVIKFLNNPVATDDIAGPMAVEAFNALSETVKVAIRAKADKLLSARPFLLISIATLKDVAWKQAYYSTDTVEETMEFFRSTGEDEVVEAIEECVVFVASKTAHPAGGSSQTESELE